MHSFRYKKQKFLNIQDKKIIYITIENKLNYVTLKLEQQIEFEKNEINQLEKKCI